METVFPAAAFAADGFCVVSGAVAPPRVAALRDAVERIQRRVATLSPDLLSELVFERNLGAEPRGGLTPEDVGDAI